jgi:hypothetical protein
MLNYKIEGTSGWVETLYHVLIVMSLLAFGEIGAEGIELILNPT